MILIVDESPLCSSTSFSNVAVWSLVNVLFLYPKKKSVKKAKAAIRENSQRGLSIKKHGMWQYYGYEIC